MVGGPSVIFDRHQEVDVTKLRVHEFQEEAKVCKGVKGLDATALYLSCLMKEMPTGYYSRREAEDGFEVKHSHNCRQIARECLERLSYSTNHNIILAHKVGKEVRIG